jgi:hypothetical protein
MDAKHDETRCKQCDHLNSFHSEDGCGTWLLGVRAVPLYRCACVASPHKSTPKFPTISSTKFQIPPAIQPAPNLNTPSIANIQPATHNSTAAQANLRNRLHEVAEGLRKTAAELKNLEDTLDNTLRRLAPGKNTPPPTLSTSSTHFQIPAKPAAIHIDQSSERRRSSDRRRRHYAMIAERRMANRRTVPL